MGVTARNISVAVAIVVSAAVAASAGSASVRRAAHRVRTYTTRGTLPLRTSLEDPFTLTGSERSTRFQDVRAAGASYVRIIVEWNAIAPTALPTGFEATDPASPAYSWGWLDNTVESAEAAGLTPILDIVGAQAWARATSHGKRVFTPKIAALGQFARHLRSITELRLCTSSRSGTSRTSARTCRP